MPALYAYLLLWRHRATLEQHRLNELAAAADKMRAEAASGRSSNRGSSSPSKSRLSSLASLAKLDRKASLGAPVSSRVSFTDVRAEARKDEQLASFYSQLVGGYNLRTHPATIEPGRPAQCAPGEC